MIVNAGWLKRGWKFLFRLRFCVFTNKQNFSAGTSSINNSQLARPCLCLPASFVSPALVCVFTNELNFPAGNIVNKYFKLLLWEFPVLEIVTHQ